MTRWSSFTLKWQVRPMTNLALQKKEETALEARANEFMEFAEAMTVCDDADAKVCDDKIVEGKAIMRAVTDMFKDPIQKAHAAHKSLISAKNIYFKPADEGSKLLGKKLGNYTQQRAREQAEKQRLLDEAAKVEHEAACELEATQAEAKGDKEVAVALREMKSEPIVSGQLVEPELRSKTSFKTDWEITKIIPEAIPLEYLIVAEAAIMRIIRATKGQCKIDGIEFKEIQTAIRRS